jgi:hypothetical protein
MTEYHFEKISIIAVRGWENLKNEASVIISDLENKKP